MRVQVIWPDGSIEEKDHTEVRGLIRRRDNGSKVRPIATVLVPDGRINDLSEVQLQKFLNELAALGVVVPATLGRLPLEFDFDSLNASLHQMQLQLVVCKNQIEQYEDQLAEDEDI